jgi:hypothetical protein
VSLFKPSVKALNCLHRLNAIFVFAVGRIAKSPYLFNWSMSSAIGLYRGEGEVRCASPSDISLGDSYSDEKAIVMLGFRVGDRSRGRFATPADFPRRDCSPCEGLHARRECLDLLSPRLKPF